MDPHTLVLGLTWFVVFIFSTTLHEAGHAFAAHKLGDSTAYEGGQVSLNPWPHIRREPFGMVIVPIASFALNGWMMGWASAPYNPEWAHRYPKRAALMAAAGPAANLLLVLISGLAIRAGMAAGVFAPPEVANFTTVTAGIGPAWGAAAAPLSILFSLNLVLFAFNLLPLPPLDGSAILPGFMSDEMAARFHALLRQPMFSLLGLLAAWKVFPYISGPLQTLALNLLYPGAGYH
ncbi:MAG: site-2 protease family protein [Acidobacteria bacterium]|jgi:Zn-dependent protease|nr:site-2 protease family protein [Acidobacteriota bacterium]